MDRRMVWKFGDVEIDADLCEVRTPGQVRQPQRLILDLLVYLAKNSWRVVPRSELLELVWSGSHVGDAAINQAVLQARKVLGPRAALLRTVRGRGYQLMGFDAAREYGASAGPMPSFDHLQVSALSDASRRADFSRPLFKA